MPRFLDLDELAKREQEQTLRRISLQNRYDKPYAAVQRAINQAEWLPTASNLSPGMSMDELLVSERNQALPAPSLLSRLETVADRVNAIDIEAELRSRLDEGQLDWVVDHFGRIARKARESFSRNATRRQLIDFIAERVRLDGPEPAPAAVATPPAPTPAPTESAPTEPAPTEPAPAPAPAKSKKARQPRQARLKDESTKRVDIKQAPSFPGISDRLGALLRKYIDLKHKVFFDVESGKIHVLRANDSVAKDQSDRLNQYFFRRTSMARLHHARSRFLQPRRGPGDRARIHCAPSCSGGDHDHRKRAEARPHQAAK